MNRTLFSSHSNKLLILLFLSGILLTNGFNLFAYQEVNAGWMSDLKKSVKEIKKNNEEMQDMQQCAEENLEKTQFYSKQGKIYIPNPDCDPDKQWKYDKLNQQSGINEYADRANFIVGLNFDDDNDDKDDDDKKDRKKKKNKDD